VLLLLRTQAAAILPVVGLLALFVLGPRRRTAYVQLAALAAAIALTLLPWLVHNYVVNGQFSMEAAFQYRIIASQYRYTGNLDIGNVELEGKSLAGTLLTFALRDPGFVLGFIANHALATQLGGILALPLFHQYNGLFADMNLYWLDWNGSLSLPNAGLIVFYLLLIGLGLGAAWARWHWVGLVPLGFSVAYSLSNGVARFSGWRYDLPADWIAYFYLAIGIAELLMILASLFACGGSSHTRRLTRLSDEAVPPSQSSHCTRSSSSSARCPGWRDSSRPSIRWDRGGRLGSAGSPAHLHLVSSESTIPMSRHSANPPAPYWILAAPFIPAFSHVGTGLPLRIVALICSSDFPRLGFLLQNESRHDVVLPTRDVRGTSSMPPMRSCWDASEGTTSSAARAARGLRHSFPGLSLGNPARSTKSMGRLVTPFAARVLRWYARNARDLPWRRRRDRTRSGSRK